MRLSNLLEAASWRMTWTSTQQTVHSWPQYISTTARVGIYKGDRVTS
jgi:hypothetical protein